MDDFAWPAYFSEAGTFDLNNFVSNGQPFVSHDMNMYPQWSPGAQHSQGEDNQVPEHNVLVHVSPQESSNVNSSPPLSVPELPISVNGSPKAHTSESPKRTTAIGVSDRRFGCQLCCFSTNTKRDYDRHLRTRKHRNNANIDGGPGDMVARSGLHCPVPDCKYSATRDMISREDNLWRHIRKVHNIKKQG